MTKAHLPDTTESRVSRRLRDGTPSGVSPVGLAHDYLLVMRGAERTFAAMAECWPESPLYTLLYDEAGTDRRFAEREVCTSYLQRLGVRQEGFRRLLPLFPHAVQRLRTDRHELVISSSSAFAHGVSTASGSTHVCYCYTPFRYAWYEEERALSEVPRVMRPALSATLNRMRRWDLAVSARVDHYIGISELSRERIHRYLGREATVIHPPVQTDRFAPGDPADFLLVVCELVRHKHVETALKAAEAAGRPIRVVGAGPDAARLQALYGDSATFLGRVDDDELARLYQRASALIVPNVEEFGIAAVEAQASGRPVVAAAAGGAIETVIDGVTGVLFPFDDVDALTEILRETDFDRFDPARARAQAENFSTETFKRRLTEEVERLRGVSRAV